MPQWQKHGSHQIVPSAASRRDVSKVITSDEPRSTENESVSSTKEKLLTTYEAADFLRLSNRTLERYRVTGGGPDYVKLGPGKRARVVYREADLVAWLNGAVFNSTSEYDG